MHRNPFRWLLPAACTVAVSAAAAQNPPPATAPSDPLDAQATVPAFAYRSALTDYRRIGDEAPVPWREANDTVGRIGGWRAYAREASAPEAPESAAPAAADAPMPAAHGDHKTH